MASMEYKPQSVEFYAPDTFERLGGMSFCTVENASAGDYVLTAANSSSYAIADGVDSMEYGLAKSGYSMKSITNDLQEQIDTLRLAIDELKKSAGTGLKKRGIRDKLRTLREWRT